MIEEGAYFHQLHQQPVSIDGNEKLIKFQKTVYDRNLKSMIRICMYHDKTDRWKF